MALALAAALLLTGCGPAAREPDDLALVRVLGVDGAGPVALTAVCGGVNQEDVSRGTCLGESFGLALGALPWSGRQELALNSVGYLLVGGDADLTAVLFGVLEDEEIGAGATVWAAEGGAGALLADCGDPASDLELLERRDIRAPTVAQALAALSTDGKVLLPVVGMGEGKLVWRGETLWKERG